MGALTRGRGSAGKSGWWTRGAIRGRGKAGESGGGPRGLYSWGRRPQQRSSLLLKDLEEELPLKDPSTGLHILALDNNRGQEEEEERRRRRRRT